MRIKLIDAVKYNANLPHQIEAWEYLQKNIPPHTLDEFAKLYRNEVDAVDVDTVDTATTYALGIDLIKEFEGCVLKAYPDPLTGGLPITIGWGSTKGTNGVRFKLGDTISQERADDLLITHIESEFLPELIKIPYWNEMTSEMQGALLSFAYNLGARFYGSEGFATISKYLREKSWHLVSDGLYMYRNPGSNVEAGLARRRRAEGALWRKGLDELIARMDTTAK